MKMVMGFNSLKGGRINGKRMGGRRGRRRGVLINER